MEIRNTTNSLINEGDVEKRKSWLRCLRNMLLDLEGLRVTEVDNIFKKYNVYFLEKDDMPRVNLDFPDTI